MMVPASTDALSAAFLAQPSDARGLVDPEERDRLIISMKRVDGAWCVVSVYGDDTWWPAGTANNVPIGRTKLDFSKVPMPLRASLKAVMYRYLRRGSRNAGKPSPATAERTLRELRVFFQYLAKIGITEVKQVTPLVCSNYRQHAKIRRQPKDSFATPAADADEGNLASGSMYKRFKAVELLFEVSKFTDDPMPSHPWPDASADHFSGYTRNRAAHTERTPLIPNEVFSGLFQAAWKIVAEAPRLLDLRDEMQRMDSQNARLHKKYRTMRKTAALRREGLAGFKDLKMRLTDIRTACYIVIASLSGCRNHELAFLRTGSYYSTDAGEGEVTWWMKSKSTKTYEGDTEWMVSEAAATALQIMERWVEPLHVLLDEEIAGYRRRNPTDLRIADADAHRGSLFVGIDQKKKKQVRTIGLQAMNSDLKLFAKDHGFEWALASHQFRRTFANYAARSQFGDLRYLREHFKHWSMDMTLGYAMNESQEMALYLEIQDELDEIKVETVSSWLQKSEPLAGGYGQSLVDWRSREETITLFKSHEAMVRSIAESTPIRSNGHAWCTAQDNLCIGNDLEKTRCGDGCGNGVVGLKHSPIYQGLYDHLSELRDLDDIGPGGQLRVERDLKRCVSVLQQLGQTVVESA